MSLAVAILLVGALGRLSKESVLWAAAPVLLLGLVDAGYVAEQRRCAEFLRTAKGDEQAYLPAPQTVLATLLHTTRAVFSGSIWPFYLGLFAIVATGAFNLSAREVPAQLAATSMVGATPSGQRPTGVAPPQMMPQRLPNGSPFSIQPPAGQRAITPVNYGARQIVRPPFTSPRPPGASPALSPVPVNR